MTARGEKRLRNKIRKALLTDEAMVRALAGPGRGFIVVERDGNWFKAVLPALVVQ